MKTARYFVIGLGAAGLIALGCGSGTSNSLRSLTSGVTAECNCPVDEGSCDGGDCADEGNGYKDAGCGESCNHDQSCVCARKDACEAAGKAFICHVPPGNPANAHNICVGQPAVKAHLNHGDWLGLCQGSCEIPPDAGEAGPDASVPCDAGEPGPDAGAPDAWIPPPA